MFLADRLAELAENQPNKILCSYNGRDTTYGELYRKAKNLAGYFQTKGYQKEDIIALYLKNSEQFLISYYACQIGGFAVLPINIKLSPSEVDYILQHSETTALIYDDSFERIQDELQTPLVTFRTILQVGTSFDRIIKDSSIPFQQVKRSEQDTSVIFYTSGTTGKPKGVMLSAANVWAISEIWADSLEITSDDRTHIVTPLFHCAASHAFATPTIQRGGTLVIEEAFSPTKTLETMEKEKVTIFFGVPAIYSILLNTPKLYESNLSSLRLFTYGAAPMPYELIKKIKNQFPNVKVQNLYGQTENSPGATTLTDDFALEKIGSVGKPLPHTEVKVVDEYGKELPQGVVGEIVVKGPQVMKGYLKNEIETKNTLKDGWMYSGDLGRFDEEGFLYIVDRKKDMMIRGGENVYPVEVEEVLYQMDEILEAAVVGLPHEVYGEVPKAYVVLKEGRTLTEEEIIQYCQKKLAKYKLPEEIEFLDTLPRNASGKVLKHVLRKK